MKRFALLLSLSLGISLLLAILIPLRVASQNTRNGSQNPIVPSDQNGPLLVGQITGTGFTRFAIQANWAYMGVGGGSDARLAVIDISTPTQPVSLTSLALPDGFYEIVIKGSYAYLATGTAGLQIIDISDPVAPSIVGSYSGDWIATGVAVSDTVAYVTAGRDGLRIIDISDPMLPKEVNVFDDVGLAWSVTLANSHLYLVDADTGEEIPPIGALKILSLTSTSPMTPTQVGQYEQYDIQYVIVKEPFAYLTYSYLPAGGGLEIVDISNPIAPSYIGSLHSAYWLYRPALYESKLFVTGSGPIIGIGKLFEIDVLTPTRPLLVSSYESPSPGSVVADGKYIYLTDWHEGFSVLDYSPYRFYMPVLMRD